MLRGPVKAALTLILLAGAAHAQAPASLIVNGSFEEGPRVGAFLNLSKGDTSLRGWTVIGEGVDLVSTGYWLSSDGTRAIDLDGSARSSTTPPYVQGGIAQTFATTPGARYRVTFDLAGNPNQLPRVKPLRVSAAGQSEEFRLDDARVPDPDGLAATGYGAAIDNVAVVAEPEVHASVPPAAVAFGYYPVP